MPEKTLKSFADHGRIESVLTTDDGPADVTLRRFAESGIDIDTVAAQLQDDGAKSFAKSWKDLIDVISSKVDALKKAS
jgi:transaldolase